jgi:FkbM family methyltransferase
MRQALRQLKANLLSFRPAENVQRPYQIGTRTIVLPRDHPLPAYQQQHRLYDRFLLSVGKQQDRGWFVDVGANVGDSAAALAQLTGKQIVCVEPPGPFSEILQKNVSYLNTTGNEVVACSEAVGPAGHRLELVAGNGTARSRASAEGLPCVTLDHIVDQYCRSAPLTMIKSDIDGLDGQALMTGIHTIETQRPALYFEFMPEDNLQAAQYTSLFRELDRLGYEISVFDNFGLPIALRQNPQFAVPFANYMLLMNSLKSTRTFYYLDIFAYPPESPTYRRWLDSYLAII